MSVEIKRVADFVGWNPFAGDAGCATEGEQIRLAIRCSTRPEIFLSGEPLEPTLAKNRKGWWKAEIDVGLWAGRLPVLIRIEEHVEEWVFDVRPADSRFPNGQAALDALIEVLLGEHRHLPWGLAKTFRDAVSSDDGDVPSPPVLHPAVLAVEGARLEQSLRDISRQPLRHLVRSRAPMPLDQCHRADEVGIRRLLARPDAWRVARLEGMSTMGGKMLIEQPVASHELSHPANRALRGLLERLHAVLDEGQRAHAEYADHLKLKKQWVEQRAAERMRKVMADYQTRVAEHLRTPLWRAIEPAPLGPAAAQAFADHPGYGRAHRSLRRLLRPDVRQQAGGLIRASLRPAFDLFELFVWLRLRRAITEVLGDGWQWTHPGTTRVDIFHGPIDGACSVARRGKWTVSIRFQQEYVPAREHFAETGGWEQGRYSLSGRRRPDVVIEAEHADGHYAWAIADAKFCAARYPIESEHLPALHVYRDALRWQGQPPSACFIVTPALTAEAEIFSSEGYRRRFNFGVIVDDVLTSIPSAYTPLTAWLSGVIGRHRRRSKPASARST